MSVLIPYGVTMILSRKAVYSSFIPPVLSAFHSLLLLLTKNKKTCEVVTNQPSDSGGKSRYRNSCPGSLVVEAALAFPLFFFAIFAFLQMFLVLGAELHLAKVGISAARELAAFSYAAERIADGDSVAADVLQTAFDHPLVKDATSTALFYGLCDSKLLKRAGVGNIYVDTVDYEEGTEWQITYAVEAVRVLFLQPTRQYGQSIRFRSWTGEGSEGGSREEPSEEPQTKTIVYLTEAGSVYHRYKDCSHIRIQPEREAYERIGMLRNASGAKYYPCEYCTVGERYGDYVYVTRYGTRWHAFSSCSAIQRQPKEKPLEDVKERYAPCKKCEQRWEREQGKEDGQ